MRLLHQCHVVLKILDRKKLSCLTLFYEHVQTLPVIAQVYLPQCLEQEEQYSLHMG